MDLISDIKDDAENVFSDSEKMKEVVKKPELVIELLKQMNIFDSRVEIDGEEIILVRPLES